MHLYETERTLARYFTLEDFTDLHEILGDPIVMENTEPAYDEEQTREFLEGFCVKRRQAIAIVHKEDKKVIGYALFSDRHEKDVYEVGWIFNKDYWNQGLAYESMRGLFDYAFKGLGAHKLFAEAIDDVKSVGLMRKLGMVHEGTQTKHVRDNQGSWRDLHFYGCLAENYKSNEGGGSTFEL